jgi:hypothetical protein
MIPKQEAKEIGGKVKKISLEIPRRMGYRGE